MTAVSRGDWFILICSKDMGFKTWSRISLNDRQKSLSCIFVIVMPGGESSKDA